MGPDSLKAFCLIYSKRPKQRRYAEDYTLISSSVWFDIIKIKQIIKCRNFWFIFCFEFFKFILIFPVSKFYLWTGFRLYLIIVYYFFFSIIPRIDLFVHYENSNILSSIFLSKEIYEHYNIFKLFVEFSFI